MELESAEFNIANITAEDVDSMSLPEIGLKQLCESASSAH